MIPLEPRRKKSCSSSGVARAALLLFAKVPVPGRVKTRLIGFLTPEQAAQVHAACLRDALELCERVRGAAPHLYVEGPASGANFGWWRRARPNWRVRPQRGCNLGERLAGAFSRAFAEGYSPVVAIGTDTPWMGAPRICSAFAALHSCDVLLGPTEDGGYYLLGARRNLPAIFRGISWGTRRVCVETLRAARLERAAVRLLPRDFDLDRPADLERAAQLLQKHPRRAPALAQVLAPL